MKAYEMSNSQSRTLKKYGLYYKISGVTLLFAFVSLFFLKFPNLLFSFAIIILSIVMATGFYSKKTKIDNRVLVEKKLYEYFKKGRIFRDVRFLYKNEQFHMEYLVLSKTGNYYVKFDAARGIITGDGNNDKLTHDINGKNTKKSVREINNPLYEMKDITKAFKSLVKSNTGEKIQLDPVNIYINDYSIIQLEGESLISHIKDVEKLFDRMNNEVLNQVDINKINLASYEVIRWE